MAPIPEDNQEKPPPNNDESDLNSFSNFNIIPATIDLDSSDDNEDNNYPDTAGYTLLSQEPGDEEDSDETESNLDSNDQVNISLDNRTVGIDIDLPDEVFQSEGGASAPTVNISTSLHPEFLAKFSDGKIPSYMQVPDLPSNSKEDALWNKNRMDKSFPSLDSTQESNIKKAMSGFTLPSENVPTWAKSMSEDQWNNVILQQIQLSKSESESCQKEQILHSSSNDAKQDSWVAEFPDS